MASKKANEVDQYIKKPNPDHRVILVYGQDTGLVSERANDLAKQIGVDLSDAFSTIRLDADDAASDPNRIADEAHTVSMFGGERLVWIKGTTQKNLMRALQPVIDVPPTDSRIIIEAGNLTPKSPLRARIEKSASCVALPCFQDFARSLNMIVDQEVQEAGLTIDRQARQLLVSMLGADRMASRAEVQKLCLFAAQKGAITEADVLEIVGDTAALAVNTVIDAACCGDMATMEHTFKRLISQGTSTVQLILALQRHLQSLHRSRCQMDHSNQTPDRAVAAWRPPVNFQRRDKVTQALSIWSAKALEKALARVEQASLETRANASLETALASTTLLAISLEARHARSNRRSFS